MRNVIGRENLITCGRTNELAHAVRTEYSCDSFMADRMGLDGTMLHYLAVRKAVVSVHKPVHSKITLNYSLTWRADRCTSRRMAFKALLKAKARLFLAFAQVFSALIVKKNGLLLKHSYVYCRLSINSLVPRRLKNRRRAPGIHCLRMRAKIRYIFRIIYRDM